MSKSFYKRLQVLLLRRWILIHVHETAIYRSEYPNPRSRNGERIFEYCPQPASKRRMIHFRSPTLPKSSSIILRNICWTWKPRCLHSKRPGSFTISVPRKISYAPLFLFFNEVFAGLSTSCSGLEAKKSRWDLSFRQRERFLSGGIGSATPFSLAPLPLEWYGGAK